MKKDEKVIFEKYCRDNNVDCRTLPLVVHHYITIGERAVLNLTPEVIEELYQRNLIEQKEAEERGMVLMITPDFTKYLLTACKALYDLGTPLRYKIIAEVLK